ncbi:MAG: JmjC domain-containing protein [Burkholderiaceae bacterium]
MNPARRHQHTAQMPHDLDQPLALLADLSPREFMANHWQKRPLLIKGAMDVSRLGLSQKAMFHLAGQAEVESRVIARKGQSWSLSQGPFSARKLGGLKADAWTLLVQGVEQHHPDAAALLASFRFLPDARLDDLMVSWASPGGGVGPHFDSYDVFLLQISGRRRWQIGPQTDLSLVPDLPLKILAHFEPTETHVLEPGDMLYLPPKWAHDGVAEGADCMTASIGFRAPARAGLANEVLVRMGEMFEDDTLYNDPDQPATETPALMPEGLLRFTAEAVQRLTADPIALACALGEVMTEPKPGVWFEAPEMSFSVTVPLRVSVKSKLLYDADHLFINGESYLAAGHDFEQLQALANTGAIHAKGLASLSADAQALVSEWYEAGWLEADLL